MKGRYTIAGPLTVKVAGRTFAGRDNGDGFDFEKMKSYSFKVAEKRAYGPKTLAAITAQKTPRQSNRAGKNRPKSS